MQEKKNKKKTLISVPTVLCKILFVSLEEKFCGHPLFLDDSVWEVGPSGSFARSGQGGGCWDQDINSCHWAKHSSCKSCLWSQIFAKWSLIELKIRRGLNGVFQSSPSAITGRTWTRRMFAQASGLSNGIFLHQSPPCLFWARWAPHIESDGILFEIKNWIKKNCFNVLKNQVLVDWCRDSCWGLPWKCRKFSPVLPAGAMESQAYSHGIAWHACCYRLYRSVLFKLKPMTG